MSTLTYDPVAVAAEQGALEQEHRRICATLEAAGLCCRRQATTPLEVAETLIMAYVARGDGAEELAHGNMGAHSSRDSAQIGGWALWPDGRRKNIDCWHIIVERVSGVDLAEPALFPLATVYADLHRRLFVGAQLALFAEVSA